MSTSSNFNYRDPHLINTGFEDKIDGRKKLSRSDKIEIGRKIIQMEKENSEITDLFHDNISYDPGSEEHLVSLADRYIQFRQKAQITHLKSHLHSEGIAIDERMTDLIGKVEENSEEAESAFQELIGTILGGIESQTIEQEDSLPLPLKAAKVFQDVLSSSSIENITRQFQQAQKDLLENMLHLNLLPEAPKEEVTLHGRIYDPETFMQHYKAINRQKKEFIEKEIPSSAIPLITHYGKQYPLAQSALREIRENLAKWDDIALRGDDASLESLQATLGKQLKNLVLLSELISEEIKDPKNAQILLTLAPHARSSKEETSDWWGGIISSLIKGQGELSTESGKKAFGFLFRKKLEEQQPFMLKPAGPAELKRQRGASPVSSRAIELQAQLFQAVRTGKNWAQEQPSLTPLGDSVNQVFVLRDQEAAGEKSAFFKMSQDRSRGPDIMEKLMWDTAVVLGMEDQFVPTGMTKVRTAQGPLGRGGIQPAQQGDVLRKLYTEQIGSVENPSKIDRREISRATLSGIIFGMFDGHLKNIFVTEDGKLKFFDNTRSCPHSNGFIIHGTNGLTPAFRCCLLDLPQAKEALSAEELRELKVNLDKAKANVGNLKAFFASKEIQAQMRHLPPGWLDPDEMISALEERIGLMVEAFASGHIRTLEDLAAMSVPSYKLAFALTYLNRIFKENNKDTAFLHNSIGCQNYEETLDLMKTQGVDMRSVKAWCDDPQVSFSQLAQHILEHCEAITGNPPEASVLQSRRSGTDEIKQQMIAHAALDFKDLEKSDSIALTRDKNNDILLQQGVDEIYADNMANAIFSTKRKGKDVTYFTLGGQQMIIYKTPFGYGFKRIDLKTFPGKVVVDGKRWNIREFVASLQGQIHPPPFKELPFVSSEEIYRVFISSDTIPEDKKVILTKHSDGKSLVVNVVTTDDKGEKTLKRYKHAAGEIEGTFKMGQGDVSLGEILEIYSSNSPESINPDAHQFADFFLRHGIPEVNLGQKGFLSLNQAILKGFSENRPALLINDQGDYKIVYKTPMGYRAKEIEMGTEPGTVSFEGRDMPIVEFAGAIRQAKDEISFRELPVFTEEQSKTACETSTEGMIFCVSPISNRTLMSTVRLPDGNGGYVVKAFHHTQDQQGNFRVGDRKLTLGELFAAYKTALGNLQAIADRGFETEMDFASSKHKIFFDSPYGYRVEDLEASRGPGLVTIGQEELSLDEIGALRERTAPPQLEDLRQLTFSERKLLSEKSKTGIVLSKSQDNHSLMVYCAVPGLIVDLSCPQTVAGRFKLGENELSLQEIANLTSTGRSLFQALLRGKDIFLAPDFFKGNQKVLYHTPFGYGAKEIDCASSPGKVICGGQEMEIAEFVLYLDHLKESTSAPRFEELPVFSAEQKNAFFSAREGILLHRSEDGRDLILTSKTFGQPQPSETRFKRAEGDTFIVGERNCTIDEVYRLMTESKSTEEILVEKKLMAAGRNDGNAIMVNGVQSKKDIFIAKIQGTGATKLFFKTATGFRAKPIDITTSRGKVIMDGREMEIDECLQELERPKDAPRFTELPEIDPMGMKSLLDRCGTPLFLAKKLGANILLIAGKTIDGCLELPQKSDGKFLLSGQEMTMEEIIARYLA